MKIGLTRRTLLEILLIVVFNICAIAIAYSVETITVTHLVLLTILNIAQTVIIISYCVQKGKFKERFALFAFNFSYFILLQGGYLVNIGNTDYYGTHVFTQASYISYQNEAMGLMYILVAQSVMFIAYAVSAIKPKVAYLQPLPIEKKYKLEKWSRIAMIVGGVAAFTKLLLKIAYVVANGYLGTYLADGSALYQNAFLDLFDKFYYLGFYGYLATFPDMAKTKKHIVIYLVYSVLTLLTGVRGEIVVNCLLIIWYLSKRDELFPKNKSGILTKKRLFIIGILAVLSVSFLYEYGFTRVDRQSSASGFFNILESFIESQGGSGRLVALGLEKRQALLQYISPLLMIIYPIRNFLLNNSVVRIFTGGILGQGSTELLTASSFGGTLTFITNPGSYENGASMGTSYVAELAVSYGMIAVVIFSFILGKAFKKLDTISLNAWSTNVLWMNAFVILVYLPRQSALQIVPESISAVLFVILLCVLPVRKKHR